MTAASDAGETLPNKAAAMFDSPEAARRAADAVRAATGMPPRLVRTVDATTRHPGRALEPEPEGIFRLMLRTHAAFAVAGFAAGVLLYGLLYRLGVGFVVHAPVAAALTIVPFVTVGAMMFAGLATLRPDHDPYILSVLEACREGRAAVVVHGRTAAERDAAVDALRAAGGDVVRTL